MEPLSSSSLGFDKMMAMEIALAVDVPGEVAAKYGLTPEEWEKLSQWPPFQKEIERLRSELEASGVNFRSKAKVLAEALLPHAFNIGRSDDVLPSVKLDAIKWLTKIADLEPKQEDPARVGTGFQININLGDGRTVSVGQEAPSSPGITLGNPQDPPKAVIDARFERISDPNYELSVPEGHEI